MSVYRCHLLQKGFSIWAASWGQSLNQLFVLAASSFLQDWHVFVYKESLSISYTIQLHDQATYRFSSPYQEFMFESFVMNYIQKSLCFDNKWQKLPKCNLHWKVLITFSFPSCCCVRRRIGAYQRFYSGGHVANHFRGIVSAGEIRVSLNGLKILFQDANIPNGWHFITL